MNNYPKISVVTITYGHENYIAETLKGVFMQEYPGEIEFIIANDNSPDDTDKVVKDFIDKTNIPEIFSIKYTKHSTNKGMIPNFIWALGQAQGKYIALCEGDDYWVDPMKLQKQVKFLEENEEYVLCFTNRDILADGKITVNSPLYTKSSFNQSEIPRVYVPTLTSVFRNVVAEIPPKLYNNLIDASLFLFLSQYGSFYYFDQTTSVYRVHSDGVFSGNNDVVNYTRSVKARLAAWFFLKKVDKISLIYVLQNIIQFKKQSELRDRKYWSVFKSVCWEQFFKGYVLLFLLKSKCIKILYCK